jgi:hypothetical protein
MSREPVGDQLPPDGLTAPADGALETSALAEPDEKVWWNTYSPRFEMPISFSGSALVLAAVLGIFTLIILLDRLLFVTPRGPTQIGLVDGDDASGLGTAGSGGTPDPIAPGETNPNVADPNEQPVADLSLPEVKEQLRKQIQLDDPSSNISIADANAKLWQDVDSKVRDALMGKKKGAGGPGAEGDQGVGPGKGGTGADSTRARSLRWVVQFKTSGGRDYLSQLSALGAEIIVPLEDGRNHYLFADLANPKPGTLATERDWGRLASKIQFTDNKPKSLRDMAEALNLTFTPKYFVAYFPKEIEEKLSRMEIGYQNRRSEDIDETVFEVIIRGGKPEVVVSKQKLRR